MILQRCVTKVNRRCQHYVTGDRSTAACSTTQGNCPYAYVLGMSALCDENNLAFSGMPAHRKHARTRYWMFIVAALLMLLRVRQRLHLRLPIYVFRCRLTGHVISALRRATHPQQLSVYGAHETVRREHYFNVHLRISYMINVYF